MSLGKRCYGLRRRPQRGGPHIDRRQAEDCAMARREQHSTRESKKPKKEKPKAIAAAPSIKRVADLSAQSSQLQKP
jgi:hypothetical protein